MPSKPIRTRGITMIAYTLGFLMIGGFGNAIFIPLVVPNGIAPEMLRARPGAVAAALTLSAAIYTITAYFAAAALWRMRASAPRIFFIWCAATLLYCGLFAGLVRLPPDSPPGLGPGLLVLVVLLLGAGALYVRRSFAAPG